MSAALVSPPAAGAAPAAPATQGPATVGTNGAAVPELAWGPCPAEDPETPPDPAFDCATATVPLDYDDVEGETIELALKRRLAGDKGARIGSLFLNPGGPGGSGIDFATFAEFVYPEAVLARFDIIGFDPRGIARSNPLVCFATDEEIFNFLAFSPPFPFTEEEEQDHLIDREAYANQCGKLGGPILEHMSTGNVARDLDLLRSAVGDEQLTYAGYSYGTQLGTTYANMFPGKVRAVVVDGNINPIAWTTGESPEQARTIPFDVRLRSDESAYATLQEFFRLCEQAGPEQCALAAGDPEKTFDTLADALKDKPVDVPLGFGLFQRVTYADLVAIALGSMYSPQVWPDFAALVGNLEELRDLDAAGKALERLLAVVPLAEPGAPGEPVEDKPAQSIEGYTGVGCLDSDDPPISAWPKAARDADKRAPYFGRAWAYRATACGAWPVAVDENRYAGPWTAKTANPVLVIGTRFDPATRYEDAERVAELLPESRLLTLEGWGLTALGSTCVDSIVARYLVYVSLPEQGTVCAPDVPPFTPPAEDPAADQRSRARAEVIGNALPVGIAG